ncbi:cysteine desulfurase family protein [Moorella naiadis]|uniref:cysteine desulfurase family protein n=1 Tax=Moorella naiadis (nom. illeg.) TaxID=3093670 RepID=UPI003D9CB937
MIYLDYNATTPVAPEVLEEMSPYLRDHFGNPSSSHAYGQEARRAVEKARERVAGLLGCQPGEIIFTSGGSEANNLALKGVAFANRHRGRHIITSCIEHPSVLKTCRYLESHGFRVTYLPADQYGMVDPEAVRQAITPETILISIMHANNEVGTIQPLAAIGAIAREYGIYFHTDAAQSVGKIFTRVDELQVDLLSVAGHKLYASKGIGALYLRKGTVLEPLIHGADHEQGRRAGTENVAGIVGLGKACAVAREVLPETIPALISLRDYFFGLLQEKVEVSLNGHPTERLPNTLNVSFAGINGARLLENTPELAASTGSACHSGSETVSPVLAAMGLGIDRGLGAVRLSLGRWTTWEEVEYAVGLLSHQVAILREKR